MDYYHPNSKVVFNVTPKAGCTTILKMFLEHCGLLEAARAYEWVHDYREKFLANEFVRGHSPQICAKPFFTSGKQLPSCFSLS